MSKPLNQLQPDQAVAVCTREQAEQLRRRANRRLLGASVLLLIAIIAVPMFLEREPPPLVTFSVAGSS